MASFMEKLNSGDNNLTKEINLEYKYRAYRNSSSQKGWQP